jgi:transcriptional regulator with GAF, ATPase, and Fis domain
MIESELFGHERGAFTGAVQAKPGRFEEASGSTLLLDEIGEMPLILQPKLLRVLEEHTLRRLGGTRDIQVDTRIVAATNRSLENEVREGRFREDLFYRINLFTLSLPLLRERRDDILPLADHFLQTQGMREKRFSPAVQHALMEYSWPGNVRELRNAVIRAASSREAP